MKSSLSFLTFFIALMSHSVVLGQDNATAVTPQLCFGNFVGLEFTFNDYDRYPEFFHDDSILTYPMAGKYKGAKDIEEYTRFLGFNTTFVTNVSGVSTPSLTGISEDGICEILLMTHSWYDFNPETARESGYNMTLMSKIYFDPIENYIPNFVVYLPPVWMEDLFGLSLGTARTHEFICRDVMKDACPDTWELNVPSMEAHAMELDSTTQVGRVSEDMDEMLVEACMDMMANLPITTGDHYIDGNSWSCRALHGAFALANDHHCPHISFVEQEDNDGFVKCQESAMIDASEYFTEADFEKLAEFRETHSDVVDLPSGYKLLYTEDMDEEDDPDMGEDVEDEGEDVAEEDNEPEDVESSGGRPCVVAAVATAVVALIV